MRKRKRWFLATFLEKVAQKAAFRESLILLGFMPSGWLSRSAQGQVLILLNALQHVETL